MTQGESQVDSDELESDAFDQALQIRTAGAEGRGWSSVRHTVNKTALS